MKKKRDLFKETEEQKSDECEEVTQHNIYIYFNKN